MFTNIILKSCLYDTKQHKIRQLLIGECYSYFIKVKYVDDGWLIDLDDMVRISV